ncbi:CRISPR-associated protein Cas4 [Methylomonas koyamae]|uniref:CRISPR-associated protein Cas4 n=1 Tax=Methylomonas koyamae TaxID=702114 RepID=UPI000A419CB7|nr:Dna2/Cas4 domain-containing protein [Methylomonas koyamae]
MIEAEDGVVTPIDYKRGKRPHVARGAYDPERVQLCVQGMVLQEHGYVCEEGALYFVQSRERVRVAFDEELKQLTVNAINGLRLIAAGGHIPEPLQDSPKCSGCSLVGICLPDEVNYLRHADLEPRPLAVMRDEALPVYVQAWKPRSARRVRSWKSASTTKKSRPRAGGHLASGGNGQRVHHHTVFARLDEARDSGQLAQLRRLVCRPHHRHRP